MYVTAQRVRNEHGEEAVHVFVYVHGDGAVAGIDWAAPDAGLVAETHPGQLLLSARALFDERLSVVSYLDLAFHNTLAARGADLMRRSIAAWPGTRGWPVSWAIEGIGARFYVTPRRRASAIDELRSLHESLRPVLGEIVPRELGFRPAAVGPSQAFVIERRRTSHGYEFRATADTRSTLEQLGVSPTLSCPSASRSTTRSRS